MTAVDHADRLTPTEKAVLDLLCEGLKPRQISERRGVSLGTVQVQIRRIRDKRYAPTTKALISDEMRMRAGSS